MADDLLGGWHPESIERIAARAASMAHDKILPFGTRLEVALGAICDMLTETEWEAHRDGRTVEAPEVKALYAAVNRAIAHESYLYRRDHAYVSSLATDHEMGASRNWQAFWVGGTHPLDPVGEAVAEKVAIRQALRGLAYVYAEAVFALADAIHDGGDYHTAASPARDLRHDHAQPAVGGPPVCQAALGRPGRDTPAELGPRHRPQPEGHRHGPAGLRQPGEAEGGGR